MGFAPADNPRYAVAVVVEHGGGGSSVAAPIARDLLLTAQRRQSARDIPISQTSGSQAALELRGTEDRVRPAPEQS